jgi:hypothetical protein
MHGRLEKCGGALRSLLLAMALGSVAACSPSPPDGVLACDADGDCPGGWQCLADENGRHCYRDCPPGTWDTAFWDSTCWQ